MQAAPYRRDSMRENPGITGGGSPEPFSRTIRATAVQRTDGLFPQAQAIGRIQKHQIKGVVFGTGALTGVCRALTMNPRASEQIQLFYVLANTSPGNLVSLDEQAGVGSPGQGFET